VDARGAALLGVEDDDDTDAGEPDVEVLVEDDEVGFLADLEPALELAAPLGQPGGPVGIGDEVFTSRGETSILSC